MPFALSPRITGRTLPRMKLLQLFQVICQTAEDRLGDIVKPRLIEADLDCVLMMDEAKRKLTLPDDHIEKAITQNGAQGVPAVNATASLRKSRSSRHDEAGCFLYP